VRTLVEVPEIIEGPRERSEKEYVMGEILRFMRFYFWLLGLFTVGRWALSLGGVEYGKAHQVFSIVTLALIASAHHAAFARAFQGYGIGRAILLGAMIGLTSQIVIFVSTFLSYALGLHTFFNTPQALNSATEMGFGAAMAARTVTLLANTVTNSIAAAIGYAMGGALPRAQTSSGGHP
jgi:hypothetical protein